MPHGVNYLSNMKILICGLPNSGKTTLARLLHAALPGSVHVNADVARATLSRDLGFSIEDRIENARRLNAVADIIDASGPNVVTDFICPTRKTQEEFHADFIIWMNTIKEGRYTDTNLIYEAPICADVVVTEFVEYTETYIKQLADKCMEIGGTRAVKRRACKIQKFGEFMEHTKDLKGKYVS